MLKLLLKHTIAEHAINIFFDNVTMNFINPVIINKYSLKIDISRYIVDEILKAMRDKSLNG